MKKITEFEAKAMIAQNDFAKLIKKYNQKLSKSQKLINHYFDTNDFALYQKKAVFRIREIGEKLILTIKKMNTKLEVTEWSRKINQNHFAKIKNQISPQSNYGKIIKKWSINLGKIQHQGFLLTNRWKVDYKNETIIIDRCIYNGHEDWELECEAKTSLKARKTLENFCAENNINQMGEKLYKYARFVKSCRERNLK